MLFVTSPFGSAAVLTAVPMGGSMVHVNLLYNSAQARLEARVDPVVPQLTPLDVPNPADDFAAADPWFPFLSPSAQGLAFNRQYGFVVDAASDPLPSNTGIWVRLLSCSPGLTTYRYRSTEPKAWEPIFGTCGATNVLQWNLAMFHPAVASAPTSGSHSAEFEAFAVDLTTGLPIPAITTAPFTLAWTVVPSARPVLELGPDLVLKWPASATNYVLESTLSLSAPNWATVTNSPSLRDGQRQLRLDLLSAGQFYRLRRF